MLARLKTLTPAARNTKFVGWETFEHSDGTWLTESPLSTTQQSSRWTLHLKREPATINHVESPPCHVPRLPEDILLVIFRLLLQVCATDPRVVRKQVRINFERMRAPFLIASVCRAWRALAISTPTLWTYIGVRLLYVEPYAYKPPPRKQERRAMETVCAHTIDMIALLSQRSKEAPLHVVMPIISAPLLFEDVQSFETSAVLMRRAIEILGQQSHRWHVWDICVLGGLSDLWRSLQATCDNVTMENGSDLSLFTLHLPALQALTIDHCTLGYGVEMPSTTMENSPNLMLVAPKLQRAHTLIGDGMQVLCTSLLGPALGDSGARRRDLALENVAIPKIRQLVVRSHTWGQRRSVLPLLRFVAPTLRFLELSLTFHGAPFVPTVTDDAESIDSFSDVEEDIRPDRSIQLPHLHELHWIIRDLGPHRLRAWAHFLGIGYGSPNLRIVRLEFEEYNLHQLNAVADVLTGCQLTEFHLSGAIWMNEPLVDTIKERTGAIVFLEGISPVL